MHSTPHDTGCYNRDIPGPAEPRWVVLVCTFEALFDPETEEEVGLEISLDHAVSPKTGLSASADDPDTWADHWAALRRRDEVSKRVGRGEFGSTWMRTVLTGFAADRGLYLTHDGEPISHERPAQVRQQR